MLMEIYDMSFAETLKPKGTGVQHIQYIEIESIYSSRTVQQYINLNRKQRRALLKLKT